MRTLPSFAAVLKGLILAAICLCGGWYITHYFIQWYVWGLAAMGLGLVILIKFLVLLVFGSSRTAQ